MSDFKCPSCSAPLREGVITGGRELWCSNIKCESIAADVGAEGRTTQQAFDALTKVVEAEREADIKDMGRAS